MPLLVGQYLGDYYLCEHIGQGGHADVYRCEHKHLRGQYAMKVAQQPLSQQKEQHFLNEIQLHSRLQHPYIIKVVDRSANHPLFLVMEYISSGTLRKLCGQQTELSIFLPYIKQIAEALDYTHQQQVVHCDVKPDNFLLSPNGTALLCDFGIAIQTAQHVSSAYGTLEYVAPEQLQRKPCPASDQYSLATTVYEWLTGECPFSHQHDILMQPAPPLRQKVPSLSQKVEDVVLKALMKRPEDRYPTVSAFISALEYASGQATSSAIPARPATTPATPSPTVILRKTRVLGVPVVVAVAPRNQTKKLGSGIGQTAASLYTYRGHIVDVCALAWSPDGVQLASADLSNAIHLWDAKDGMNVVVRKGGSRMILNLLWSPDGACLAVADEAQAVQFWDVKTGNGLFRYQHRVGKPDEVGIGLYYPMAWSLDGAFMISASDDQPLEKWNTTTGQRLLSYNGQLGNIKALAWSPDGRCVAFGGASTVVQLWDVTTGDTKTIYRGHRGHICALCWSPDGRRVASADTDGLIHVWNAVDGAHLFTYSKHRPRSAKTLAWSPDGSIIASAGTDKKIHLWDAHDGHPLDMYAEHTESINVVAWSPDGSLLASASDDRTVRVWSFK